MCTMTDIPSALDLPSARELGISSAHRRAILRESMIRVDRACMADCIRDASAVRASERIDAITLEIVGGEAGADALRASHLETARRFHAHAVDYLRRRAAGESAASIRESRWPRANDPVHPCR